MCGIFGFVGKISKNKALHCLSTLNHRGPDKQGFFYGESITLGHQRLSILDLSEKGTQPMSYAGGRYWITYNGEIYNFIELREELSARGHKFQTETDTEVLLASYAQWGEECLERLNGMWALAIWDAETRSLFLSRDRFGKKPLFYTFLPDGFAFASEMKALLPLLPAPEANVSLIRDQRKIFLYENTQECLIKGIRRLPAGHFAHYRENKLSTKRWWCTLDHLVDVPNRYEDQVERLQELFLDACKIRMRSDVPVGTALSGGLDSSSTIGAMATIARNEPGLRMSRDWQHAFVACFPGTPLDETHYAKVVTDHLGIEATFLDIDPQEHIGKLLEYLYLFEEIYITSPIPFIATYREMRKEGVYVTVDGHGADELFGGYGFDFIFALRSAGLSLEKTRTILTAYYERLPKNSSQFQPLPPKPVFWLEWHIRDILRRLGRFRNKGLSKQSREHPDVKNPNWKRLDQLNKILYLSTHRTVLPTLLRNYDRYSMSNGVEIRMPFMDYRIVSFAFSIPWSSKIRNNFSKNIVRDMAASFLPAEIAYRKSKIGFNSPIVDWMKGPLKSFFLDTINSRSFKTCDLIDAEEVESKVKAVIENPSATYHMGEEAWTLLAPYLWEQAVLKRKAKKVKG